MTSPQPIEIKRKTNETDIRLKLLLGGERKVQVETGIGFFDHLLQTLALPFSVVLVRLAGAIHDRTQDYAMVFGLTIPIFVLAGIVLFFVRPSARR